MNSDLNLEFQAIFKGVDETIFDLNSIIKDDGYEFISIGVAELESQYGRLFNLPKNLIPSSAMKFKSGDQVSSEFYSLLKEQPFYRSLDIINHGRVIHLRRIEKARLSFRKGLIDIDEIVPELNEMQGFINKLIRKLWYFKSGAVTSPLSFAISLEERSVISKSQSFDHIYTHNPYTLNADELKNFKAYYLDDDLTLDTLQLPMKYFESCYSTNDNEVKFLNLVTALEALFNRGPSQITHTISRHLALIISKTRSEFQERYTQIKKLYGLRSTITHGQKASPNLSEEVLILEELVRVAIIQCGQIGMSKDDLFNYLNAKGFAED